EPAEETVVEEPKEVAAESAETSKEQVKEEKPAPEPVEEVVAEEPKEVAAESAETSKEQVKEEKKESTEE
ncbi:MAG: hypothetical protein ISS00_03670, partial [Candidatus Marinimicrobia bacterium]|nr:hypothetical protein [Candidatus Neomarinimicrobiota bacterium]